LFFANASNEKSIECIELKVFYSCIKLKAFNSMLSIESIELKSMPSNAFQPSIREMNTQHDTEGIPLLTNGAESWQCAAQGAQMRICHCHKLTTAATCNT
jgi:hypothetical protein